MSPAKIVLQHVPDDPSAPAVVRSAKIAFGVMSASRTDSWADAAALPDLPARVRLTSAQQTVLEAGAGILPYLRRRGRIVTVIGCTGCDRFVFADGKGSAPKRCFLTPGCVGELVKASTVTRRAGGAS